VGPAPTNLPTNPFASVEPPRPQQPTRPTSIESRAAPRTRRQSHAQLLLYPAGRHPHPFDVTVVDYSATGIGIVHDEGLLIGQRFIVREPYVTKGNTCLFTVVRSDHRADGTYSIGLHVSNTLKEEHDPLLAEPPAPGIKTWMKVLYLLFAIGGTIAVIALAVVSRVHR
jgi:hypothetical protein